MVPRTIANVKDFGATGDGITDDTIYVQNAIDALVNGGTDSNGVPYGPGGGVLYFPYGVYRLVPPEYAGYTNKVSPQINVELNAAIWTSGSNITLQGDGAGSIIHQDGNSNGWEERPWCIPFCFSFGTIIGASPSDPVANKLGQYPEFNTGNILVKDLTFRGNVSPKLMPLDIGGVQNAVRGIGAFIAFVGSPRCFARDIRIVNCIFEDANKGTAVCPLWVDDIQFENCTFRACKDFIIGNNVRAAANRNIDLGDDNELMNLSQDGP
jgi:hypothetical protein